MPDDTREFLPVESSVAELMPILTDYASRARTIIEIGVGKGNGSTRAFAAGLRRDGIHILVDCSAENLNLAYREASARCLWTFCGDSRDEIIVATTRKFLWAAPDLIFIDTEHTKEHLAAELRVWAPIAGPGTVWLFHDTWMWGKYNPMTDAIHEFILAHPEWEYLDITRECHGLGRMTWRKCEICKHAPCCCEGL
jgi:cephalosporin hydroxylase